MDVQGIGAQTGPLRPDWGPTFADLTCTVCKAGWVGPEGEPCWWCDQRLLSQIDLQTRIDRDRLRDLLTQVRDGSEDAIAAAVRLLRVAVPRGTLARRDVWRLQQVIGEAEVA
jgi:hypothetical protein